MYRILLFLWVAIWVATSSTPACAGDRSADGFYIIAGSDTLLYGEDIESYVRTIGFLVLTVDGYWRWTSFVNHLRVDNSQLARTTSLTDSSFRIEYKGATVVEGYVASGYESKLKVGVRLCDAQTKYDRARLSLHYGRFEPDMPPNPLESEEFLEYFRKSGKLVDWAMDR